VYRWMSERLYGMAATKQQQRARQQRMKQSHSVSAGMYASIIRGQVYCWYSDDHDDYYDDDYDDDYDYDG